MDTQLTDAIARVERWPSSWPIVHPGSAAIPKRLYVYRFSTTVETQI